MMFELDKYSLKARLYPAFLILLPMFITGIYYIANFEEYYHYFTALVSIGLFTYLLAQLGRDKGKMKEPKLHESWGGKPSIQILRHSNNYLDEITKARYHKMLADKIPEIIIPTKEMEDIDTVDADLVYESCTRYLISKTRDTKRFPLLFKENVSYGFRRNLWGMKTWGIIVNIVCVFIHICFSTNYFSNFHVTKPGDIGLFAYFLGTIMFWFFVVTKNWIRIPAYAYAERLYEVIDEI